MKLSYDKIPAVLKDRPQWVLWKLIERDGEKTKVPFGLNGRPAKANDSSTWCIYLRVVTECERGDYAGIGYEF